MNQKNIILITGASSGIGLTTALAAARAGHTVVATVRSESSAKSLAEAAVEAAVTIHHRIVDVTNHSVLNACVQSIIEEFGALNAVINNAGIGHVGTIENETAEEVRSVMEVNFFSVVELSKAAMPHLRASSGKLINVTSVGGIIGQPFNEAYCASKFAVEGFMESLAPVAKSHGVSVCVVEPGAVASRFIDNLDQNPADQIAAAGVYEREMVNYVKRVMGQFSNNAQQPEEVAATIIDLLAQDNPPFRIQTSDAARALVGLKLSDSDGSKVQAVTSGWVHG